VWLIIIYYNNDQNVAGATLLNPLIDAAEAALAPLGRVGLSPSVRRSVAAKVPRVHHLAGEDIDDPGVQEALGDKCP
jgi:hypothetical protein